MAGNATNTTGLGLSRSEVLKAVEVRQYLKKLEYNWVHRHSVDCFLERDVQKGSGGWSTLQGPETAMVNQTNIRNDSKVTLGKLMKGGEERI